MVQRGNKSRPTWETFLKVASPGKMINSCLSTLLSHSAHYSCWRFSAYLIGPSRFLVDPFYLISNALAWGSDGLMGHDSLNSKKSSPLDTSIAPRVGLESINLDPSLRKLLPAGIVMSADMMHWAVMDRKIIRKLTSRLRSVTTRGVSGCL